MRAAVVIFPGSNREVDVADAIAAATGRRPEMVWHGAGALPAADLIVLPGGFSYGDYLRTGAIAAHSPIMRDVAARAAAGVPVLGVCNGFQILAEAQLVPGILLPNASLKFVCRDVHLRVESQASLFTRLCPPGSVLRVPVAHHDGNYFADTATLDALEANGQVAFRYCAPDGAVTPDASPNGSARNIAGVFNARRNVLGMMPHPENAIDRRLGSTDGRRIFDALVEAVAR
ncbi:MAG: phosphoribosylformylglycinamidine synthase subunit PurQ [Rhodospirillales bacterium]